MALWLWLPSRVSERAALALRQRWGVELEVESVHFGVGSVRLNGVSVRSSAGDGLDVAATEVTARGNALGLLFSGSSAIEGVELAGVRVDVDLEGRGYTDFLGRVLRRSKSAEGKAELGDRAARAVAVRDAELVVRHGSTELVRVTGGAIRGTDQALDLSATQMRVRQRAPGWSAEMSGVQLLLERKQSWRIRGASAGRAEVLWRTAPVAIAGSPASHVTGEEPDSAEQDRASDAQQGAAAAAAPQAPDAEAAGGAAWLDAWLTGSEKHAGARESALARFLVPGAELKLERGTVATRSGDAVEPVLDAVQARVRVESASELLVSAHGKADGSGRLDIELRVWPGEMRADGRLSVSALPLGLLMPLLPRIPWHEPERSRVDADLAIKTESLERLALEGSAELRDAGVLSARIASGPVRGIGLGLNGRGHFYPLRRRLEIESGELSTGEVKVAIAGNLELTPERYAFDLTATLPQTRCTSVVHSVPHDLLGDLSLAEWTGTLGGRLRFAVDSLALSDTVLDLDIKDHCAFVSVPLMADLRRFAEPFVHSALEPDNSVFEMETGPGTNTWTRIEAISPFLLHAVLTHEDPRFFEHRGFSLLHIRNALVRNLREGRYAVGASTITMQLVKNVFLRREKTLARKAQEVLLTWWVERMMEKPSILELYLNVIEYGPSVYGVRHAARHYFNRLPAELSPAESVFLATILPNPKRYHGYFERGALTPAWAGTMRKLLQRLGERGAYSKDAVQYGLQEIENFKFVPEGTAAPPRELPVALGVLPGLETGMPEDAVFDALEAGGVFPQDGFD